MILQRFDPSRLTELMRWFPDPASCRQWGGPGFRFPFTAQTFRDDARLDHLPSWSLIGADDAPCGFGQYYLRLGRCHLARLAIAPAMRGRGLGSTLIRELCERGRADLGTDTFSLFVLPDNERALRLYRRLGFSAVAYPEPDPVFAGCIYMIAADG